MSQQPIDDQKQIELEAAAFRRLVSHLRNQTEVQNIDLMILAGFCRNCLADWYLEAAQQDGLELTKNEVRERIYGMPYTEWKSKYHKPATPEQSAAFERRKQSGAH